MPLILQKARLEVAWGLKPGQFDFNGPLNTIPCKSFLSLSLYKALNLKVFFKVRANWHICFDKKEYVFLPDEVVLGKISKALRENLPDRNARVAADEGCPLVTEVSYHVLHA